MKLGLHKWLAEVLINVEQNNLAVTTTNTDLIVRHSLNGFDTLGTNWLTKNEHFVFDLVRTEISRFGSDKEEFLIWFGESHALVVSDHGSSLHHFVTGCPQISIKLP